MFHDAFHPTKSSSFQVKWLHPLHCWVRSVGRFWPSAGGQGTPTPPPKKKKWLSLVGNERIFNMFETVQNKIRSWSVCQYKLSSATCCIFLSGRQQFRVAFISYMTFFVTPLHRQRVSELSKSLWFDSVLTEIYRSLLRMFSLVGKWSHTFSKSLCKFHAPKCRRKIPLVISTASFKGGPKSPKKIISWWTKEYTNYLATLGSLEKRMEKAWEVFSSTVRWMCRMRCRKKFVDLQKMMKLKPILANWTGAHPCQELLQKLIPMSHKVSSCFSHISQSPSFTHLEWQQM